jgi:hypothetical protein
VEDGTGFLSPLPDSTELVGRHSGSVGGNGYYPSFIYHESGKSHVENPRLDGVPLPQGWRRHEHEETEYYALFVNDVTGEGMASTPGNGNFDPRLGIDALKSRGLDIEVSGLF